MYMQSILDKMDILYKMAMFFVLVSRTCFHLIKCLCGIDHFVGYSPSNSSHFISLVFCSELQTVLFNLCSINKKFFLPTMCYHNQYIYKMVNVLKKMLKTLKKCYLFLGRTYPLKPSKKHQKPLQNDFLSLTKWLVVVPMNDD